MKKILKIISMMLMLSFFAVPMTACVSDSGYPEDETFGKFGVTVTKSENYETDKQITLNPKAFFAPVGTFKVDIGGNAFSSLGPVSVVLDPIAFNKLQAIFDKTLTFKVTEKEKESFFNYSHYIGVKRCNGASISLYLTYEKELLIYTESTVYCCSDIKDLDIDAIVEFENLRRIK